MSNRILALFFLLPACAARTPQPAFVQARTIPEPVRPPAVVTVPRPMPLPGQLKRLPVEPKEPETEHRESWRVIENANQQATQAPSEYGYFNAIMTYDYAPGALYQVYSAPLRITAIALQPGEQLTGPPAIGDTVRWVIAPGKSMVSGSVQRHVYVKPTRPGLQTTLTLTTDRRTYFIELHSWKETAMAAVSWRYPQDEIAAAEDAAAVDTARSRGVTSTQIQLDAINFGYRVEVKSGRPSWVPVQVFDDGQKTFIRFPQEMLRREAPALFVLSGANDTQLVNYRVKNETYVVDRLFDAAELRIGADSQEIVRIVRTSGATRSSLPRKGH